MPTLAPFQTPPMYANMAVHGVSGFGFDVQGEVRQSRTTQDGVGV